MRMKHAWKVVLLGATLLACAAARAQDESCAVDREFLKGLLGIPSVTADKAKTDEAVAFVRARLESRGVVCAVGRPAVRARRAANYTISSRRCGIFGAPGLGSRTGMCVLRPANMI